jgi:hypothetical protein
MKLFLLTVMILKRYREVGREGGGLMWYTSSLLNKQFQCGLHSTQNAKLCFYGCSLFVLSYYRVQNDLSFTGIRVAPHIPKQPSPSQVYCCRSSPAQSFLVSGLWQYFFADWKCGLLFNERKGSDYHWSLPLYWGSESAGFHSHSTLYPLSDCCYRKSNTGVLEYLSFCYGNWNSDTLKQLSFFYTDGIPCAFMLLRLQNSSRHGRAFILLWTGGTLFVLLCQGQESSSQHSNCIITSAFQSSSRHSNCVCYMDTCNKLKFQWLIL